MTQADHLKTRAMPRIFVVYDQSDKVPLPDYIQGQPEFRVVFEALAEKIRDCSL
jgi:hypothetical protein